MFLRVTREAKREAFHCNQESSSSHCNVLVWHGNLALGSHWMRQPDLRSEMKMGSGISSKAAISISKLCIKPGLNPHLSITRKLLRYAQVIVKPKA